MGKTNLLNRIDRNEFNERTLATIGIDFIRKKIQLANGLETILQIWDTAGAERFRNISRNYLKGSDCVLLIYDITSRQSYEDAINDFNNDINNNTRDLKLKYLIGNKIDYENERVVNNEEAEKFAEENGFYFFEISCKDCAGIDLFFNHLINEISKIEGIESDNKIQINKRKKIGKKG